MGDCSPIDANEASLPEDSVCLARPSGNSVQITRRVCAEKLREGNDDGSNERNVKTCRHRGARQIRSKAWILVPLVLVHGEAAKDARAVDDAREAPCSSAHRHRVSDEG